MTLRKVDIENIIAEYDSEETQRVIYLRESLDKLYKKIQRLVDEQADMMYDLDVAEEELSDIAEEEGWEY